MGRQGGRPMRRILQLLTVAVVMGAMMAMSGTSASAQSPCPPTGPSNGPATLLTPEVPRWAGFVCLDEVDQRFFCPPGFEHWLFRNPPGSSPPFQGECVELASSSIGGESGAEPTQSGEQVESAPAASATVNGGEGSAVPTQSSEQAESAPAESAPAESDAPAESVTAESAPAESTPAESAAPATTAGSIGDSVLEAYNNLKGERRLLGVGILALTLIVALLMAWRLPMRRNVGDPQAWGIPQQQYYENYAPAEAPRQASPETAGGPEGEPNGAASGAASGPPPEESQREPSVNSNGTSPAANGAEEYVVAEGTAVAASSPDRERLRRIRHLRRIRQQRSPSDWRGG